MSRPLCAALLALLLPAWPAAGEPPRRVASMNLTADEILVVHDELDLRLGEAKMKLGGGVAGHNGLKDIRAQLGTADFWRLRLGIGHPRDSEVPQQQVVDYVLKPPLAAEREAIEDAIGRALDAWPDIAAGDFERAMMRLHTKETE